MSTSIFQGTTRAKSAARISLRPPVASAAAPAVSLDDQLLALLDAPLAAYETALEGFARKERDVREVFASLGILESRALHLRLSNPRGDDTLATRFARLTVDRRVRLLTFLADARRRAALAAVGGR